MRNGNQIYEKRPIPKRDVWIIIIRPLNTFAPLGSPIYNRHHNTIHVGFEDCTRPQLDSGGIECDLPHPLFLVVSWRANS